MIKVTTELFTIQADTVDEVRAVMDLLSEYSFSSGAVPAVSDNIPILMGYVERLKSEEEYVLLAKEVRTELAEHYWNQPLVNTANAERLSLLAVIILGRLNKLTDSQIGKAFNQKGNLIARRIYNLRHRSNMHLKKEYDELLSLID